ncbi:MAG: hypothetical protein WC307_02950 [Candidatus Nanoarchaeia archaeon]|jgi:hypothetical protein
MGNFEFFIILGVGILFVTLIFANQQEISACPEDAKLCPDGTVLSRNLTNCEFDACPFQELIAYCNNNTETVEQSGNYIKTLSNLLGGGFTVYFNESVNQCPVVAPNYITDDCKYFMTLNWTNTINCSLR